MKPRFQTKVNCILHKDAPYRAVRLQHLDVTGFGFDHPSVQRSVVKKIPFRNGSPRNPFAGNDPLHVCVKRIIPRKRTKLWSVYKQICLPAAKPRRSMGHIWLPPPEDRVTGGS